MFSRGPFSGKNQTYRDTANNFLNSILSPTSSPQPQRREEPQREAPRTYSPSTTSTYSPSYNRTTNVTNNYSSPSVERIVERVVIVERESPKSTPELSHTQRLALERGTTLSNPSSPVLAQEGRTIDGVLHPSGCFCSCCRPVQTPPTSPIVRSVSHELPDSPKLTPIKRSQSHSVDPERVDTPMPIRKESKEEEREVDRLVREGLEKKMQDMQIQRERETKELNDLKSMYAAMQQRLETDAKLKNDRREQKEFDKLELLKKQELEKAELLKREIEQKEAVKTKHEKEIERNKEIYKRLGTATAKNAVQRYYDKFGVNVGSGEPVPAELLARVEQDVLSKSAYANFGSNPNSRTNSPAISRSSSASVPETFGTGGNVGSSPAQNLKSLKARIPALDLSGDDAVHITITPPNRTPEAEDSVVLDQDYLDRNSVERSGSPGEKK